MRYRFKGIVRTTGQTVEGHAHGESPDEALQALSEHGIVTESLREDPEPFAQAQAAVNQPFNRAIDSALDVAAAQIPFDAIANRYKGKNVWVLDREKIRRGVAQVVDQALGQALSNNTMMGRAGIDVGDVRKQVADAISGLFKDNRNLTSNLNAQGAGALEPTVQRIEALVHRAESVLAQMTMAIGRIGSGGGWGGGGGPRRFGGQGGPGGPEQNAVLLEIFKDNLRLRGIEIDEPTPTGAGGAEGANGDQGAKSDHGAPAITLGAPGENASADNDRPTAPIRPADPLSQGQ